MDKYEQKKLIEVVLYVLSKTGGMDYYHLFKVLYFAEREHLLRWGCKLIPDDFHALKYGPVPTVLYDVIKKHDNHRDLSSSFFKSIKFVGDEAESTLLPLSPCDERYLSNSEKDALDFSINKYSKNSFKELLNTSHDKAWEKAFNRKRGKKIISPIDNAIVGGADNNVIEYIKDNMLIDSILA